MIKQSKIILSAGIVSVLLIAGFFCCNLVFLSPAGAQTNSSDIIAVRIIKNPNHFSALKWYNDQGFRGSPQSIIVDGYEGVRDGRTVYVNVANVVHESTGDNLYTNIYLISYNQSAENPTVDIFSQILSHWKFNYNLVSSGHCRQKTATECVEDEDCTLGDFCDGLKARIIRDVKRLSDIADVDIQLVVSKAKNGYFPKLKAGTYLPNITLSVWPSWSNEFSKELGKSLPTDPVNVLGKCPGYNKATCWDEATKNFVPPGLPDLPNNSLVYYYTYIPSQNNYKFCAVFESGLTFPGAPVCFTGENVCLDFDEDGYGKPPSPKCTRPQEDCDDSDPDIGGGTCPSIYTTMPPSNPPPSTCFPQCTIGQLNQCIAGLPNNYQVCIYDVSNCPVWQTQSCLSGQVCSGNGNCITPCAATCTIEGQFQCTDSSGTSPGRQVCVDSGGGCLKWQDASCVGTNVCRPSDNQCVSPCPTDANCNPATPPPSFDPSQVYSCPGSGSTILSCQVSGSGCWTTKTDACSSKISCTIGYTAICDPGASPYPSCICYPGACSQTCTASPGCLAPASQSNSIPASGTCCISGDNCYTCPTGQTWVGNTCVPICTPTCTTGPGCLTTAPTGSIVSATGVCCGTGQACYDCPTGFTWNSSACVPICTDTCASLGYQCGTQTVCGASQNCGTCTSGLCCGSTCQTPACIIANDSICNDGNSCTQDICNSPNTCTAACQHSPITTCSMTSDGCCPNSCNAGNDADCTDTTPPVITITSPTPPSFTTTSATINISGTASDDVGVTSVTWVNNVGGSGIASGATNWNINNVALTAGNNVITVTAHDAAGHTTNATITITYNAGCTFTFTFPCTF